jgi:hypothetical protein
MTNPERGRIRYTDGSYVDLPLRPGETMEEFFERHHQETEAEWVIVQEQLRQMGFPFGD